jgi:hypothetical protein
MKRAVWIVALAVLIGTGACTPKVQERQRLEAVYMPTFSRVPPKEPAIQSIRTLAKDWREGSRKTLAADIASVQGLALAIALGVMLLVAWDFRRLSTPRNLDLLLMFAAGALLFDVMRFFSVIRSPTYLNLLDSVFSAVVAVNLWLMVRAVRRVQQATPAWLPNVAPVPAVILAIVLLAANIGIAVSRAPDDAGWFVNLGAQRLRERGRLPYGDPLLTATPGAAYGPLLYAAHVPFQILLSPDPVNPVSPLRPDLTSGPPYYLPSALATKLCTVAFHIAGVFALFVAARRLANTHVAWALVCLYCGSLAVLGIGGREDQVAGITFVSHIAPASMTLLAFAALSAPALSGTLLALATGVGFYPAFMAPAWLGFYWNDAAKRIRFVLGFAIVALTLAGGVYAFSRPAGDRSRIGTIMYDTFGHHTDPDGYGSSVFGFWGQREGLRRLLSSPLLAGSGLTSPMWLTFAAFLGATFFLARGKHPADLALLVGAVAIGATLVKPHATGTYLAWSYPLLLLGFFTNGGER